MSTSTMTRTEQSPTAVTPTTRVSGVPFGRLLRVELRKLVDTRAGTWLLVAMVACAGIVVAGVAIWGENSNATYADYAGVITVPFGVLLPVLGTMAATAEWSQRAGLTTFTLEPRRWRVVVARTVAAVALGIVVVLLAWVVAAGAYAAASTLGDAPGTWVMPPWAGGGLLLMLTFDVLLGLAFGFAFLNTPVAIVASLALPTAWMFASALSEPLQRLGAWFDLARTTQPLAGASMTGTEWAQLGTSFAVWVALPMAIGTWRVLTREVK